MNEGETLWSRINVGIAELLGWKIIGWTQETSGWGLPKEVILKEQNHFIFQEVGNQYETSI